LKELRFDLEAEGIRDRDAHELLSTLDWDVALATDKVTSGSFLEEAGSGPSVADETDPREGEP
jgi:hypothetical protein